MALISKNNTAANTWELEVSGTAEQFEEAVESAYRKQRGRISVPGFRKGKATRKMIEKLYGESVFYDEAVNSMVNTVILPAVEEADLELVDTPKLDVKSISKEDGVKFTVTCTTKPEVTVENYKGIEVEKPAREVKDSDVEEELKRQREKNGRLITVEDRAAKEGDTVNIDFKGFIDGVPFEGGAEKGFDLKLGSGNFIPGFEAQVAGHITGEEFTIDVTFPEDYQMEEVAGKPAQFEIKLNEIKETELPELDDDFAKDVSEFDTLDEYKADVKKMLEERAKNNADVIAENRIFDAFEKLVQADVPAVMFDKEIDRHVEDFEQRLQSQGLDMQMYLTFSGMTMEQFRDSFRENSEKSVRTRLGLEKVAQAEGLTATEEKVEEEIKKLADRYNIDASAMRNYVDINALKADILVSEAADLIKNSAVIKEAAAE